MGTTVAQAQSAVVPDYVKGRRCIVVGADSNGMTLNKFLLRGGLSSSVFHKLVRLGKICLLDRTSALFPVKPYQRVVEGQVFAIPQSLPFVVDDAPYRSAVNIDPIWSDDHYLAFNKPSGVLVHRGSGHSLDPCMADVEGFFPVHRLDALTTGVLIGGRTREAAGLLSSVWATQVNKIYHAVCSGGAFVQARGSIVRPLRIIDGRVSVVDDQQVGSLEASTEYQVLDQRGPYSLVELRLRSTGRKHQLRVHLASIGHPVVGDPLYSEPPRRRPPRRRGLQLYLHCSSIQRLSHPYQRGSDIDVSAPCPWSFENLALSAQ